MQWDYYTDIVFKRNNEFYVPSKSIAPSNGNPRCRDLNVIDRFVKLLKLFRINQC